MLTTMLVEDNISFRQVFRDYLLSQFPSMKVVEASKGEEAFKGLASYPIDLIFMDIKLGVEDGLVLTKKIKSDNQSPAVVILSAYNLDEYRKAASQFRANGFIGKDSADLVAQVSTVVGCFHGAKEAGRSNPGCLLL